MWSVRQDDLESVKIIFWIAFSIFAFLDSAPSFDTLLALSW